MRKKRIYLIAILMTALIIVIAKPALAAKPVQLVYVTATEVQQMITSALTPVQTLLNSTELRVTSLEGLVASQSAEIHSLKQRVETLEHTSPTPTSTPSPTSSPEPTPSPSPNVIVFAQNRPTSFTTDFVQIPPGYTSMTFHVSTTGSLYGWSPIANVNSFVNEQHRITCPNNVCPDVTIPIISGFYQFSTGTSSGNVTATASLNAEPGSSAQTLGYGVNLPFTSGNIETNPNSTITVTVGQVNPQHLTGISLQRNESGAFVEKQHLTCDGGAVCPLTSIPLLGGQYRVVIEGSGPSALVAALIRPQ